jgi:hypothetical protein
VRLGLDEKSARARLTSPVGDDLEDGRGDVDFAAGVWEVGG